MVFFFFFGGGRGGELMILNFPTPLVWLISLLCVTASLPCRGDGAYTSL